MKRLIVQILILFFLTACAPTLYVWEHESGLGDVELKEDQSVCLLYAEEQTPPFYYDDYPYDYSMLHYYGGHRHHYNRHFYGHNSYFHPGYYGGYNTYAYQQDISRACMKGKGWNRIEIEEG
jgi:hypothetical protein